MPRLRKFTSLKTVNFENGNELGWPVLAFHKLPENKSGQVWEMKKDLRFGLMSQRKDGCSHHDSRRWFACFDALRLNY